MTEKEHTKRRHRFTAATVVALVATSLIAPAASAEPPADVLERARSGVAIGQEKAKANANEHAAEAPGQAHRRQGLERAEAAIAAAADRKAARDAAKADGDKPGRGLGRGHADEVHAMLLLEGGSPSAMSPHGEWVRTLAQAFNEVKADHPGQGQGPTEKGHDEDGETEDE